MNFYVYEHIRNDTEACFYIGKGKEIRYLSKTNRNKYWNNVVKKAGGFKSRIIAGKLTEQESLNFEIKMIAGAKRSGVILVNLCDGGEGTSELKHSPQSRQKMREREVRINDKRKIDPNFDLLIKNQRSSATKFRKEGYQKLAGEIFRSRFNTDAEYASKISSNRKKAQNASIASRIEKMRPIVIEIRKLRIDGWLLKDLAIKFNMRESTISNIINRKCYAQIY